MRRAIGLSCLGLFALVCAFGPACAVFGAGDAASAEQTAGQIAQCQSLELSCLADGGTEAGPRPDCYALYNACMGDAGLR